RVTRFFLECITPVLAQSEHASRVARCPLSGVKRTLLTLDKDLRQSPPAAISSRVSDRPVVGVAPIAIVAPLVKLIGIARDAVVAAHHYWRRLRGRQRGLPLGFLAALKRGLVPMVEHILHDLRGEPTLSTARSASAWIAWNEWLPLP